VDRYVRVVAVCFKGNEDLSRWMNRNISEEGSMEASLIAFSERFKALESV
jgi:hypothetical protein